jgi:hypothetical protein
MDLLGTLFCPILPIVLIISAFSRERGGWADYQIRHWREEPHLQTAVRGALRLLFSQHRYRPFLFCLCEIFFKSFFLLMFHYSFLFSFHIFSFLHLFLLPSSIFVKSHLIIFHLANLFSELGIRHFGADLDPRISISD